MSSCFTKQTTSFTDLLLYIVEADSAAAAGLSVTLVEREGNAPLTDEDKAAFNTVKTFTEIVQVRTCPFKDY